MSPTNKHSSKNSPIRSADWDDDELSRFFDAIRINQKANSLHHKGAYQIVTRINACFIKAGNNLTNAKPIFAGLLLMRCKYAYMAAASMAMSGQVVECFSMMRLCLECAGYAMLIFSNPALQIVLMNRHTSDADKKKQKDEFQVSKARESIRNRDKKLAENFQQLYDRAIDFGGHPNQHALFGAMTMTETPEQLQIGQLALHGDPKTILHSLKSVAQTGLTALCIFQFIFKSKFELLGIRAEIDVLKSSGV